MTNGDWRYWPDAGLTVMGLVAIVALAIAVSGYLSYDFEMSAARGFLLVCASLWTVCASSLTVVVVAAYRRQFAWPRRALCRPMRSRPFGNLDCGLSS